MTLIAILWTNNTSDPDDLTYSFLSYGNGAVRVYHRDRYDPRVDLGRETETPLPFFDNWPDAHRFMCTNPPQTHCQVATSVLHRVFDDLHLAEPPEAPEVRKRAPARRPVSRAT